MWFLARRHKVLLNWGMGSRAKPHNCQTNGTVENSLSGQNILKNIKYIKYQKSIANLLTQTFNQRF